MVPDARSRGSPDYDELTPVFMLWEERIRTLLDPPVQVDPQQLLPKDLTHISPTAAPAP